MGLKEPRDFLERLVDRSGHFLPGALIGTVRDLSPVSRGELSGCSRAVAAA